MRRPKKPPASSLELSESRFMTRSGKPFTSSTSISRRRPYRLESRTGMSPLRFPPLALAVPIVNAFPINLDPQLIVALTSLVSDINASISFIDSSISAQTSCAVNPINMVIGHSNVCLSDGNTDMGIVDAGVGEQVDVEAVVACHSKCTYGVSEFSQPRFVVAVNMQSPILSIQAA